MSDPSLTVLSTRAERGRTMQISELHTRESTYRQIYEAAYAVARNQQPDVAAHAEDIAQSVVLKFTQRHMTAELENPARWGAVHAAHECRNFANRKLPRARAENVPDEEFWNEQADVNPAIYPYRQVAGADAVAYALSCLSDREREMVYLVEAGYAHAEIAEMMGYAGARSVTTTMNRIRGKIVNHVGGQEEIDMLLHEEAFLACMSVELEILQEGESLEGDKGGAVAEDDPKDGG